MDDFLKSFAKTLADTQLDRAAKFEIDNTDSGVREETEEELLARRDREKAEADDVLPCFHFVSTYP